MVAYLYNTTDGSVKEAKAIDRKEKWNYLEVRECTLEDLVVGITAERVLAAKLGYGLERLISDDEPIVRMAVARKGYRLDILREDVNLDVQDVALKSLKNAMKPDQEVLGKIICVEGYKAFKGVMRITPKNTNFQPYLLGGDWLYKPDTLCWYCRGCSFTKDVCEVVNVY